MRIVPRLKQAKRTISYPIPSPVLLPQKAELVAARISASSMGSAGDKVVGNAGWLISRKRWDIYLQIAARVAGKIPEARFLIAGDGPERAALQHMAAQFAFKAG